MKSKIPTDAYRAAAAADFGVGLGAMSRLFGLDDGAPPAAYRFDGAVRARAMRALVDVSTLYDHSRIEPHPEHPAGRRAQAAREDATVQALIRRVSDPAPIRGPQRGPANPQRASPAKRGG